MIKQIELAKAILAIQDLIIHGRKLAYQNYPNEQIAEFLDSLEYLPALILETEDRTDLFEQFLEDICIKNNISEIFSKYKR